MAVDALLGKKIKNKNSKKHSRQTLTLSLSALCFFRNPLSDTKVPNCAFLCY